MAVADMTNSQLRLVLYDGDDLVTGKPIYKAKSFNNANRKDRNYIAQVSS